MVRTIVAVMFWFHAVPTTSASTVCKSDSSCTLPCPFGDHNVCVKGECQCTPNYTGVSCKTDKNCPLPCPMGQVGTCESGTCRCNAPATQWLEARIASARAAVQAKYGAEFVPIEVDINPGSPNPESMAELQSAVQLHYDAVPSNATFPSVEAWCNMTASDPSVSCAFAHHDAPIMGDNPNLPMPINKAGYLTAESALAAIRAKAKCVGFAALSFRFPVLPCASEHLYIYGCFAGKGATDFTRYFVGARTGRVCRSASTETGGPTHLNPFCKLPQNLPDCI